MNPAKFCLRCGAPLAIRFSAGRDRPTCSQCGFVLYHNPVPVVAAWVERDGKILLLKRRTEPLRGFWAPPTGYMEWDESAEQAAAREVLEETGFEIALDGLLGVYSRADVGVLFVVYRGHITGGQMQLSDESEEIDFFAPAALPPQPAQHRGTMLDEFFLDIVTNLFVQKS